MNSDPWLVVIDPQRIFADADSDWGSPMWPAALSSIVSLLPRFRGRTIVTRWVPPTRERRIGSWRDYMAAWPFADRPPTDPYFGLVEALREVDAPVTDAPTFGKWEAIAELVGPEPHLVVTGVATDCCVISTVLPAADAGAHVTVVSDACAGSSQANHDAALQVMGLYPPQVRITTSDLLES